MNWKKRKKLNRVAKSHGFDHYYMWKRYVKLSCVLQPKIKEFCPDSMINVPESFWNCFWICKGKPNNMIGRYNYE